MKEAIDDHRNRIVVITQVLTVIGRRLDDNDRKMGQVDENDGVIKAKLKSLEQQIVANDNELKQKLCALEGQVTSIAQVVQAGTGLGQQDASSDRIAHLESRVDAALK